MVLCIAPCDIFCQSACQVKSQYRLNLQSKFTLNYWQARCQQLLRTLWDVVFELSRAQRSGSSNSGIPPTDGSPPISSMIS